MDNELNEIWDNLDFSDFTEKQINSFLDNNE